MKKLILILINTLIICIQLISCTGCRKYFAPNNHHYSKINEHPKLINDDPKLQLKTNDRYAIPAISKEFNEPIKDFTSPHYINEDIANQTITSPKLNKEDNSMPIDNNLDKDNNNDNDNYTEEDVDINLEETD